MTVNPHFTSNGKTPTGTCGLCTCKIEIATKMDFDFLLQMSFDLCVVFFSPILPFPVHDAIHTITSFICTEGRSASSFCSCVSHIALPIFQKAEQCWQLL